MSGEEPEQPPVYRSRSRAYEHLVDRVAALPAQEHPVATWLLDIDGVLNVIGRPPRNGFGKYEHNVVHAFEGLAWRCTYSPVLVSLLNELSAKKIVQFRWLTTWEHDGPRNFAPAVGLHIGAWVAGEDAGQETWWKLDIFQMVLAVAQDLIIWTDDDIDNEISARQVVDFVSEQRAIVVSPEPTKGLMPADVDRILTAIETEITQRE